MKKAEVKKKVATETRRIAVLFVYLALFLGAFTTYKRLILGEYHISYAHYGYSLLEALILAKVLLLGDMMRLGEKFHDRPLIITTLYQTLVFSLLVLVFTVLEEAIIGFFEGKHLTAVFQEILSKGKDEILAQVIVMFIAFIPLFALRETNRRLGGGSLYELFFKTTPAAKE